MGYKCYTLVAGVNGVFKLRCFTLSFLESPSPTVFLEGFHHEIAALHLQQKVYIVLVKAYSFQNDRPKSAW